MNDLTEKEFVKLFVALLKDDYSYLKPETTGRIIRLNSRLKEILGTGHIAMDNFGYLQGKHLENVERIKRIQEERNIFLKNWRNTIAPEIIKNYEGINILSKLLNIINGFLFPNYPNHTQANTLKLFSEFNALVEKPKKIHLKPIAFVDAKHPDIIHYALKFLLDRKYNVFKEGKKLANFEFGDGYEDYELKVVKKSNNKSSRELLGLSKLTSNIDIFDKEHAMTYIKKLEEKITKYHQIIESQSITIDSQDKEIKEKHLIIQNCKFRREVQALKPEYNNLKAENKELHEIIEESAKRYLKQDEDYAALDKLKDMFRHQYEDYGDRIYQAVKRREKYLKDNNKFGPNALVVLCDIMEVLERDFQIYKQYQQVKNFNDIFNRIALERWKNKHSIILNEVKKLLGYFGFSDNNEILLRNHPSNLNIKIKDIVKLYK